mmetsp:Transcript_49226/g.132168  ORF Transcript_49226/g.132168 Transcript_49226/m.132168 type:complete len:256 (-) Transcript_49226:655-1422(-)
MMQQRPRCFLLAITSCRRGPDQSARRSCPMCLESLLRRMLLGVGSPKSALSQASPRWPPAPTALRTSGACTPRCWRSSARRRSGMSCARRRARRTKAATSARTRCPPSGLQPPPPRPAPGPARIPRTSRPCSGAGHRAPRASAGTLLASGRPQGRRSRRPRLLQRRHRRERRAVVLSSARSLREGARFCQFRATGRKCQQSAWPTPRLPPSGRSTTPAAASLSQRCLQLPSARPPRSAGSMSSRLPMPPDPAATR